MPLSMSLVPLPTPWRTILSTPQALVLYNPSEGALSVLPHNRSSSPAPTDDDDDDDSDGLVGGSRMRAGSQIGYARPTAMLDSSVSGERCPACGRPYHSPSSTFFPLHEDPQAQQSHYFDLLSQANTPLPSGRASPSTASSRFKRFFSPVPSAPGSSDGEEEPEPWMDQRTTAADAAAEVGDCGSNPGADGYYRRFFVEQQRLGMGAYGSVFLCEHVLDAQPLGLYAVKKVAVGTDRTYRRSVLREVEVLKSLRHENIITYHHAWIEKARFSSFGPLIDSLHILMQYAPLGSLEDYLANRAGETGPPAARDVKGSGQGVEDVKAAFRARRGSKKPPEGERRGVRLMSRDEVDVIFGGVVRGLGYLHNHDLLHLDLKCSNVLLYVDESNGDLIPRPLISDFGTTRRVVYFPQDGEGKRTGNTGTLEYCAPENVHVREGGTRGDVGKEGDHWGLGLILHKLLFFRLPYSQVEDLELLANEIAAYAGFFPSAPLFESLDRRGLPRHYLWVLSSLLHLDTRRRMSCRMAEDILKYGIREDGHQHYPFDFYSAPQPYEPTDAAHSLAPYMPPRSFSAPLAAREEATVVSLDATSNASQVAERGPDGRETPVGAPVAGVLLSPAEKGSLRLLPPSRILRPSPASRQRLLLHLPSPPPADQLAHAALVLVKFLSVHLALPRATLGAQVAVLALALASGGGGGGVSGRQEVAGVGAHVLLLGALWMWAR